MAIILGLLAGSLRAGVKRRRLLVPDMALLWLVPIAFAPQFIAFFSPSPNSLLTVQLVPYFLVTSQVLLLLFAAANVKMPGFWFMLVGTAANLIVILLNGGWMPISPETVNALAPNALLGSWQIGQRLGLSKDIVLMVEDTRLWFLSDRFLMPRWLPYQVAFSIGDTLLAGGAFWFMWNLGNRPSNSIQEIT